MLGLSLDQERLGDAEEVVHRVESSEFHGRQHTGRGDGLDLGEPDGIRTHDQGIKLRRTTFGEVRQRP